MERSEEIFLREWQTVGPAENARLAGRFSFAPEETETLGRLGRSGRLELLEVRDGLRISTTSFVGILRLGRVTLHIRPKLAELSPAAMAVFLRYALGIQSVSVFEAQAAVPLEQGGFADLIALALLEEVNTLLRAGLLRDYETHATWRASPRGRFDLTELARQPMRGHTQLAIPCRVSQAVTDNVLNRLVSATLETMHALVDDRALAFDLHRQAALLTELCPKVPLTLSLIQEASAALDRRSWRYRPILEIAELILQGLGTTLDDLERRTGLPGFLLDMNLLFERFLTRLLSDFGPAGLRVETQVNQGSAYRWRENPQGWRRPRLRPDIVLYDRTTNKPILILDAKYKPIDAARRPSPEDLYQLTLYSMSFGQQQYIPARIVYPDVTSHVTAPTSSLDFQGLYEDQTLASIGFYGLPVLPVTAALRSKNEAELRQIVSRLIA